MSVSSHLTPEPERRLWLIWESMQSAIDGADARLGGLALLSAGELLGLYAGPAVGPTGIFALLTLGATAALAVFGLSPLSHAHAWAAWLEPQHAKSTLDDSLVAVDDVAKYAVGELINRLDKYLGGGITATRYYEDIVGQIARSSRVAVRKRRVLRSAVVLATAGQVALLVALSAR